MNSPATNQNPGTTQSRSTLLVLLLLALWICQLRFPPLSYPAIGLIIAVLMGGLTILCAVKTLHSPHASEPQSQPAWTHPALLPGMLFLIWAIIRWAMAGLPVTATDEVMTWVWAAMYFCAGLFLLRAGPSSDMAPQLAQPLVKLLTLAGLVCGIYAILQYHYFYDESHADLLASLGDRPPDRTETALLHHLSLKRVASFLGDPNTYALFATITIAAAIDLLISARQMKLFWRSIAILSIPASLFGIFYTGSRGGVLDLLLVFVLFGTIWFGTRRHKAAPRGASATAIMLLVSVLLLSVVNLSANQDTVSSQPPLPGAEPESGWIWRSDTIRERAYYLEVGLKMIAMRPLIGLGPGSVNEHFGRLKSPDAREARHLHNWPVHLWAEYGVIGVALVGWFAAAVLWSVIKYRLWHQSWLRACVVLFLVMLFDGLLQTSWANRELMSLTGLACACLVSASAKPQPHNRQKRTLFLQQSAIAGLTLIFLVTEIPFLSSKNHKQIASDALATGDLGAAGKHAMIASQWLSRDPEPYQVRAQIALKTGDYSAAGLLLQKALELSPQSAALNSQMADFARITNRTLAEEPYIRKALMLYPSHPQYNLQYAEYLMRTGQPDNALKYASRARTYSYLEAEQQEIDLFLNYVQANPQTTASATASGVKP